MKYTHKPSKLINGVFYAEYYADTMLSDYFCKTNKEVMIHERCKPLLRKLIYLN